MIDSCHGTGVVHWMTDSYDRGYYKCVEPCASPNCPAKKEGPMLTPSNPSDEVKPVVIVSIPVQFGGYTGQRDQWESATRTMGVELDGANIVLTDTGGSLGTKVTIPKHGLEAALAILGTLE